ncbi:MAG: FRG domain-containing protein [bacterium]|nr:FRG domain-containing protein [bacterium]
MSIFAHYNNIFEAIRAFEPSHAVLQCMEHGGLMIRSQRFDLIDMGDGKIAALSFGPNMGTFYRGEKSQFLTCKPNLYRYQDRNNRIVSGVKTCDFILYLKEDPTMQEWEKNDQIVDYRALAQHYDFPTDMLDITSDIMVAAFFATHSYNSIIGRFVPVKDGIGRLRRYNGFLGMPENRIRTFGMQPYGRPGFQNGYGLVMEEKEDFSNMSLTVEFEQDPEMNERFSNSVPGQDMFFPPEPVIQQVAFLIKNTNVSTNKAISLYCRETGEEQDRVVCMLKERGISVVDAPLAHPLLKPIIYPVNLKRKHCRHRGQVSVK